MTVYLLEGLYIHSEGNWIEGVFDTKEKAISYMNAKMAQQSPEDDRFFHVIVKEVQ